MKWKLVQLPQFYARTAFCPGTSPPGSSHDGCITPSVSLTLKPEIDETWPGRDLAGQS
jgi:hypothetical protein